MKKYPFALTSLLLASSCLFSSCTRAEMNAFVARIQAGNAPVSNVSSKGLTAPRKLANCTISFPGSEIPTMRTNSRGESTAEMKGFEYKALGGNKAQILISYAEEESAGRFSNQQVVHSSQKSVGYDYPGRPAQMVFTAKSGNVWKGYLTGVIVSDYYSYTTDLKRQSFTIKFH